MARKNVVLCGFMGCGKSTVGSLLSRKMGMSFVDLDSYIEKKENKTISQIFEDSGEEYFRQLERQTSQELSQKKGLVIAAGGGTLTYQVNVDAFRQTGTIVLLDIPVEVVSVRLQNDTTRPLLNRPDKDKVMKELYDRRLPLYKSAADVVVDATQSPMQVCSEIIAALE
ncbi:MAG: shikimate kinase [Clostridia bacterium]|nr:shikimate kinase [Clostridia bacterium]